jgi:hypothetical protein
MAHFSNAESALCGPAFSARPILLLHDGIAAFARFLSQAMEKLWVFPFPGARRRVVDVFRLDVPKMHLKRGGAAVMN